MTALLLSPLYLFFHIHALCLIYKWMGCCKKNLNNMAAKILVGAVYGIFVLSLPMGTVCHAGGLQRLLMTIGNFTLGASLYEAFVVIVVDILILISKRRRSKKEAKAALKAEKKALKEAKKASKNEKKKSESLITEVESAENKETDSEEIISEAAEEADKKTDNKGLAIIGGLVAAIIVLLCVIGVINARIIRTTEYQITIDKKVEWMKELNVVMVGDFHLGYNVGSRQMKKMVKKINAQNPDIVLIVGDIFDNDYDALDDPYELVDILKDIDSRYGVYAVYGNHDVQEKRLAGFPFGRNKDKEADERMDKFLKDADIELLRDEYILIDNKFYLYGRPDAERPGKGIEKRKSADEIVTGMNMSKPVIVMDHQPKEMTKLSEAGVDLDLSGHTHNGQVWPCNLLTRLMWDNSYGYKQIGNMHSIVTSGVGTFGPNMRIGTKAEICHIEIKMGN